MYEGLFRKQWFEIFKKKIIDLNLGNNVFGGEELDLMPIIYCCLINRMVSIKPRKIHLSKEFDENISGWENIKNIILSGGDINNYMSKRIRNWKENDLLLYSAGITHFHLSKNKSGGIKDELVFGIFTDDDFYGICIGNHNDIYKLDYLLSIVRDQWNDLLIFLKDYNTGYDEGYFRRNALDRRLQANIISPAGLDNHMHSALIEYCLNGNCLKIPLPVYCAYENEIKIIDKIENTILFRIKNKFPGYDDVDYFIEVDGVNEKYNVFKENNSPIIKKKPIAEFSFPKNQIMCSNYENRMFRYS